MARILTLFYLTIIAATAVANGDSGHYHAGEYSNANKAVSEGHEQYGVAINDKIRVIEAGIESTNWEAVNRLDECRLQHIIPTYGKAIFVKLPGKSLSFKMAVHLAPQQAIKDGVKLFYNAPRWRPDLHQEPNGILNLEKNRYAYGGEQQLSQQILQQLQQGKKPTFVHDDWLGITNGKVAVGLTPINFTEAYRRFLHCANKLPTISYDEVQKTTVYFDAGSISLDSDSRRVLDDIMDHIAIAYEVDRIEISGYTDNLGSRDENKELSRRRVLSVQRYLQRSGVPAHKFVLIAHGERRPAYENSSKENRAKNRRVVVRLYK